MKISCNQHVQGNAKVSMYLTGKIQKEVCNLLRNQENDGKSNLSIKIMSTILRYVYKTDTFTEATEAHFLAQKSS